VHDGRLSRFEVVFVERGRMEESERASGLTASSGSRLHTMAYIALIG
jgi:hypothetical protein